ncbi:hypothetical protein EK904_011059 [Melospiza melodia maxima]|nr:hypothetical protein EK904_011059 [Melospiza melodia maxima]
MQMCSCISCCEEHREAKWRILLKVLLTAHKARKRTETLFQSFWNWLLWWWWNSINWGKEAKVGNGALKGETDLGQRETRIFCLFYAKRLAYEEWWVTDHFPIMKCATEHSQYFSFLLFLFLKKTFKALVPTPSAAGAANSNSEGNLKSVNVYTMEILKKLFCVFFHKWYDLKLYSCLDNS